MIKSLFKRFGGGLGGVRRNDGQIKQTVWLAKRRIVSDTAGLTTAATNVVQRRRTRSSPTGVGWGAGSGRRAVKQTEVCGHAAQHLKMLAEPAVADHCCRVAAHQHGAPGFKHMVVIQHVAVRVTWDGTLVCCHLSVVLTLRLQHLQLEQSISDGVKLGVADHFLQLGVIDLHGVDGQDTWVSEANVATDAHEITSVCNVQEHVSRGCGLLAPQYAARLTQGAGQTLAPQNCETCAFMEREPRGHTCCLLRFHERTARAHTPTFMLLNSLWEAAVTVDIREVELAALFQRVIHTLDDLRLCWAQVDHTVACRNIDRLVLNPSLQRIRSKRAGGL